VKRRPDPSQFLIDWKTPAPVIHGGDASTRKDETPEQSAQSTSSPVASPLVQVLPWDFKTTFPDPTEQAIEAGVISDEDRTPEGISSIHDEHAREALMALQDLDFVMDYRRCGVDPDTRKPPKTHAGKERLRRLDNEELRLGRHFANLMAVYEDAFGADAATAFNKAIRAWHAGIEVQLEQNLELPSLSRPEKKRRVPAVLPVPRPLPTAVAAGNFGLDERGKPIRPSPTEVREITETHAEKLIDADEAQRKEGIKKYAEDFGARPAAQLETYLRKRSADQGW
jgi:hypothetical protein